MRRLGRKLGDYLAASGVRLDLRPGLQKKFRDVVQAFLGKRDTAWTDMLPQVDRMVRLDDLKNAIKKRLGLGLFRKEA